MKRQAKAIAGVLVGALGEALTYGLIPDRYRGWAQLVIVAGIYAGVYRTRNAPAPAPSEPTKYRGTP